MTLQIYALFQIKETCQAVSRELLPRFSYDQLTTEEEIKEIVGLDGPVAVSINVA